MARITERRAIIAPEIIAQLKTLFGTAPNVHARLQLHPLVTVAEVTRGLAGWPIKTASERRIFERWTLWRRTFMRDPKSLGSERAERDWLAGDCFAPSFYDPVTDLLPSDAAATVQRFTLPPGGGS